MRINMIERPKKKWIIQKINNEIEFALYESRYFFLIVLLIILLFRFI